MKLTVEMPDPDRFLTSQVPHLPRTLFRLFPRLAMHKCENGLGLTFRQECRQTEIPHLFEHLIIELQSQAQPTAVLRGETEWNWTVDPRGRFHVSVDFENELLALGALRLAERLINALDKRNLDGIDIDAEMNRLSALAKLGRELLGVQAESHWNEEAVATRRTPKRAWGTVALSTEPAV
ncbi:MAG: hypothetical protein H7Z41_17350 [Cytophagales bacterium]|nr:hypothetical protein [Armatimonadota bacterium]